VVCDAFNHALKYVYKKYKARLTSLLPWEHYIADFVRALRAKGSVYRNLVGLVDGHFQPFCRPGGPGCKTPNVFDFETFNGKERDHGLKFQALCLANGTGICWGPHFGPKHDSTMMQQSDLEGELETLSRRLRLPRALPLCVYGDNAYAASNYVVRAAKRAYATPAQRVLDKHMAIVRVLVENLFAVVQNMHPLLASKYPLRLGSSPIGMLFPTGLLLVNLQALLYGNNVVAAIPTGFDIPRLSIEDYLS